jgi:hypothetical protein
MGETFNFHGPTTFINRPVDTVIHDFQNTYGAVTSGGDLARLLRLVLTSQHITIADKEQVGLLVQEAAASLGSGSSGEVAKSRLEAIRAVVARAADIAEPALAIIGGIVGAINS